MITYFSFVLSFVFHVTLSNSSLTPDDDIVFEDFARLRLKGVIDMEEDCWIFIISFIKSRSASHQIVQVFSSRVQQRNDYHLITKVVVLGYFTENWRKVKDLLIYIWKANEGRDTREFHTFLLRHVKIISLILCQLLYYGRQANL